MQHKTKKIWLIALLSLLITALFAASFTYARYYKETGVTGGKYDDTIEFVGANKYIVYTPEELVAAIENGYSYIEIADGAKEPFVITDGVTDVTANLVLDINGHSLVRNSRNPLIDVQENVSVVIVYDSKASGSFYNPVGSLLQASGGTLTIATGNFTSGPKEEDYVTDVRTTDKGVSYSLENYTVYYRDGYTPGATSPNRSAEYIDTGVEANLPKIVPVVIDPEAEDRYGNIYFENGIDGNDYIKDDTFLIYTEETVETPEDATVNVDFSPLCDVASCDFYYYYEKSTEGSGEDKTTTYAVIYGYHDVMNGAEQQITKTGFNTSGSINNNSAEAVIWPYAAVRMTEGEAFIRGGTYTNQFGTAQSYGIYARGGSLSVQGENTSFTSVADGVCIRCTTEDGSAPALNIENGSFTSYNGDTVQVNGGTMTLTSGSFTKTATKSGTQSAVIRMTGGELACSATAHDIVMTCGGAADSAGKESIYSNLYGIYSVGGTVDLNNAKITVSGTYSAGILAEYDQDAQQQVQTDKEMVELTNTEITVKNGITQVQNDTRDVLSSTAISTRGGTVSFEGGTNIVTSDGIGITASPAVGENGVIVGADGKPVAVGQVTVVKGETIINADNATGVYVYGGNLQIYGDGILTVNSTILANSVWAGQSSTETVSNYAYQSDGVLIDGGSLVSNGTLNVTMRNGKQNSYTSNMYDDLVINSFAVRVLNAETVTILNGDITNNVGGGVYVGGGTVTLGDKSTKTGPTVKTEGEEFGETAYSGPMGDTNSNWKYYKNRSGGHAVEVNGGTLTIYGGLYKAALGNGILVRGGEATVLKGTFSGNDTQKYKEKYGGNLPAGPAAYYALNLLGGIVTVWDGTFVGNGSSASVTGIDKQATANIYGGTFDVEGQAGFSVYQNVALTFTPNHAEEGFSGSAIAVSAGTTAIAVENTTDRDVSVTINGGTYASKIGDDGKRDGIWYSNPYAKLFISGDTTISANAQAGIRIVHCPAVEENVKITGDDVKVTGSQYGILYGDTDTQDSEAAVPRGLVIAGGSFTGGQDGLYYGKNGNVVHGLVISGGEFKGIKRSGLYFNVNQWVDSDGNVSISGGTFIGIPKEHTEYYAFVGWKIWYTDGAMGAESEEYDEGLGWSIQIFDLVDQGRNVDYYSDKDTFELTQINHGQWTEDDRQTIALNVTGCKYSKVVVR